MLSFDKLSGKVYSFKSRDEAFGDYAQENMAGRVRRLFLREPLGQKPPTTLRLTLDRCLRQLKDMASPELLQTKIGAQVMLVVNLDPKRELLLDLSSGEGTRADSRSLLKTVGLVNGTRGVIVDFVRRPSDYDLRWNVKDSKNGNKDQVGSDKWKAEASVKFLRQQEHDLIPVVHFGIGKDGLRSMR